MPLHYLGGAPCEDMKYVRLWLYNLWAPSRVRAEKLRERLCVFITYIFSMPLHHFIIFFSSTIFASLFPVYCIVTKFKIYRSIYTSLFSLHGTRIPGSSLNPGAVLFFWLQAKYVINWAKLVPTAYWECHGCHFSGSLHICRGTQNLRKKRKKKDIHKKRLEPRV